MLDNGAIIDLKQCQIFTTSDISSRNRRDKTAYITFAVDRKIAC
ncbi:MAG: hypothetical protein ACTTJC_01625 [Campylobacter sp.]